MTTAQRIKTAFDAYFDAPLEVWQNFADLGELISVEKDHVVKANHTIEHFLYFILSGSGGIFLWNKNNFVCTDLCYENDFFGDYMSFLSDQTSPLEVIVFEDSELFRISKSNFERLTSETEFGNKLCRFAAEGLFIHKQRQQIDILTKTAKERYMELLTKQTNIVQRTPQKFISSFLGITPQSLSRIRSELA